MTTAARHYPGAHLTGAFMARQALPRSGRQLGPIQYLPTVLFLAFFFCNTRLSPLNTLMFPGRWAVLLGAFGLAALIALSSARRASQLPPLSLALMASFLIIATTIPHSSNPIVSLAKWGVFLVFLLFCVSITSLVTTRDELILTLRPLILVFVVLIWTTPPSALVFPQTLSSLGYINGFMRYGNSLGAFLVFFGLPAVLYDLESSNQRNLFKIATVGLAATLVMASGTRTAAFPMLLILSIAFWRWKGFDRRGAPVVKVAAIVLAAAVTFMLSERVRSYAYKYPRASSLLESRSDYWDATRESFMSRPMFGSGLGVQEQQAGAELSYTSKGAFREQGSAYLGLLEELGLVGSLPLFLLLLVLGLKHGVALLRSNDPLQLLFSRSIVAGLLWGIAENYMLALGNAVSILFFYSLFMSERLGQMKKSQRAMIQHYRMLAMYRQPASSLGTLRPETG